MKVFDLSYKQWKACMNYWSSNINNRRLFAIILIISNVFYLENFTDFIMSYTVLSLSLCIPFLFKEFAFDTKHYFKNCYWYVSVTYCLPFFFTTMVIYSSFSAIWIIKAMSALLSMLLLLSFRTCLVLLCTGIIGAALWSYKIGALTPQIETQISRPQNIELFSIFILVIAFLALKSPKILYKKSAHIKSRS